MILVIFIPPQPLTQFFITGESSGIIVGRAGRAAGQTGERFGLFQSRMQMKVGAKDPLNDPFIL